MQPLSARIPTRRAASLAASLRWGHFILPYILEIFAMPPWLAEGEVDIMVQICKAYPNGCDRETALSLLGEDESHGHHTPENVGHNETEEAEIDEASERHPRSHGMGMLGGVMRGGHIKDVEARLDGLEAGVKAIDVRVGSLEKRGGAGSTAEVQAELAGAGTREVEVEVVTTTKV